MLLLVEWELLPAPLLDLSAYIEPRRDRYYDALLRVSTAGDWVQWFSFFLEAVERQAQQALARARKLNELRETMRARIATPRASALPAVLVDALFDTPMMTIPLAASLLNVTRKAAGAHVERLVGLGLLTEVEHGRRTRLFVATEIMDAVQREPVTNKPTAPIQ